MSIFDKKKLKALKEENNAKRHTIMVVDDEKAQLTSLVSLLSEEYNIITAQDGQAALDIIRNMENAEEISLIISDQRMPKLTGLQLFEKIKDIIPDTLRIILTAYDDKEVIIDAIKKAKIYKFILKPFEPEDLKLTLKRALESFDLQQQLKQHYQNLEQEVKKWTNKLEQANRELYKANKELRELRELSLTDPLTGLLNIRYLNDLIERMQKDCKESPGKDPTAVFSGRDFTFFILEIDEFKMISETYHRSEFEILLKQFSDILKGFFGDPDILVRRGDAEFLIINRVIEKEKSQHKSTRLLRAVEDHIFDIGTDEEIDLTCSLGFACYPFIPNHYDAIDWNEIINIAEFARDTAKNSGGSAWVGLLSTDKTKPDNIYRRIIEEIEKLLVNGELKAQSSLPIERLVWKKDKIMNPKIRKRSDTLKKLDNLIFNPHTHEAKIHNIFENNLWILGKEYSRMSSNETLKKTVREVLGKIYKGDSAKNRPDLLLATDINDRYLLNEFKRPAHTLDRKDEGQVLAYRDELNEYEPNAKIEIMLIGGKIKKNISAHNLRDDLTYLSYQSVISRARNDLEWRI